MIIKAVSSDSEAIVVLSDVEATEILSDPEATAKQLKTMKARESVREQIKIIGGNRR